jgi:threonine/homoserine/homoserine lactone efflux protein
VDGVVAVLLLGTQFAAFLGVAVLVIVTPGQDTALTIRNSLLGGRRSGVFTALGVASGNCTWAVATSAGIAALLVASEPAFVALRLFGAGYLIFLGAQALLSAVSVTERHATVEQPRAGRAWTSFRQGLVSNLGNPKIAVFFPSLLPQFADSFAPLLTLGVIFAAMTLVWLTAYAFAVAKAGQVLLRPRVRRLIDAVVGVVLVAFGVRLATDPR